MGPEALSFNVNVALTGMAAQLKAHQKLEEEIKGPVRTKRQALAVLRLAREGAEELEKAANG